jgi:4'-phosphopantetheinyl transferase
LPPAQLRFSYNAWGKPALTNDSGADALRFNLSHSHQLMICAVTCGRDIGIDLEHLRSDLAQLQIAEQFFSSQEVAVLSALPVEQQTKAFFNCWTRKEAYIKARGEGLSFALDQFDVQFAPGESAALLRNRGDAREVSRWSLQELTPAPGYVGALAVEGHAWRLECWQWP